jgi:hypothetical protein
MLCLYIHNIQKCLTCINFIFVIDCGDQKFYDRHNSSLQLKTDNSAGKLHIPMHLID